MFTCSRVSSSNGSDSSSDSVSTDGSSFTYTPAQDYFGTDSFTYTVLATLESLGFCKPGEGPDFVANQRTAPGGDFPMNTNGGGLSYCHTGMYGMFAILESVRQLRGEAEAQVDGVETSLVHAPGGMFSATSTLILGNQ